MQIKEVLKELGILLDNQAAGKIRLHEKYEVSSALQDFKALKSISSQKNFESMIRELISFRSRASSSISDSVLLDKFLKELSKAEENYSKKDYASLLKNILVLQKYSENLQPIEVSSSISFSMTPKLPLEIQEEMEADVKELERCYKSNCFRSVIILCGRILETALHRKYYDATGRDILETSPEIGLGNLVKKLNERNIEFDPGLTQQIHLINQVRVFSVHKKQKPFYPSKSQAGATILYTLDILEKIF